MKHVDEYRDDARSQHLIQAIARTTTRPWSIMEICGGQTHAIIKYGIDRLLPKEITLVHGPGCPVCVTAAELIDQAISLAMHPGVTLVTFGDMARVPGSTESLFDARARGGTVDLVYSPLDAVQLAREHPDQQFVFFAVGFETTAPATALAVQQAKSLALDNFSMLVAHVLVPPAMAALLSADDCAIDGFLAAGHVCTVMGMSEYPPIARRFGLPIVVTGFEPVDILHGLLMCITQLEAGQATVQNQYRRVVKEEGNEAARRLMSQVFEPVSRQWRGIGTIADSGLGLREAFRNYDAQKKFSIDLPVANSGVDQSCGRVLKGVMKPAQCPKFGQECKPQHPVGAPMVSSEGACAAYFRHRGLVSASVAIGQ